MLSALKVFAFIVTRRPLQQKKNLPYLGRYVNLFSKEMISVSFVSNPVPYNIMLCIHVNLNE